MESGVNTEKRAEWGGKIEFILTCVGYAVGLGNIWRFPYLCYKNGGGAFLLPYFITLLLVGIPLFFLELSLGQFASLGPIAIWKSNPLFKGIGYTMVITNTLVSCYYNVIVAWSIYYLFSSFTSEVPWASCGNNWNTIYCTTSETFKNMTNGTILVGNVTIDRHQLKSPSEEFFYNKVLQMSDGIHNMGGVVWQLALCLLLAWIIVFFVLINGITSLGKVVYFTSIFPYILLTIMLIRGVTLENATEGMSYYVKPVWSELLKAQVWSDAATQIFFSLATCSGGLIAMASYNNFHNNCFRDSLIVPLINCLTSFYGGFVIFSVLGYMAHKKGVSVSEVAASGPGLVFVVYPEALGTMPIAPLWSILFFLMMLSLGLSSMFSMVECFFCAFIDEFSGYLSQSPRKIIVLRSVCCAVFYLLGLSLVTNGGFYLFSLMDVALSSFPLLIAGLIEVVAFMYIYGYKRVAADIVLMLGFGPNIFFRVTWLCVTPVILFMVIVFMALQYGPVTLFSGAYVFPPFAEGIYWAVVGAVLSFMPIIALIYFCKNGGYHLACRLLQPNNEWGPALDENRSGRYSKQPIERLQVLCGLNEQVVRNRLKYKRPLLHSLVSRDVIFHSDPNLNYVPTQGGFYDDSHEQCLSDTRNFDFHGKNPNLDQEDSHHVQISMANDCTEMKEMGEKNTSVQEEDNISKTQL